MEGLIDHVALGVMAPEIGHLLSERYRCDGMADQEWSTEAF